MRLSILLPLLLVPCKPRFGLIQRTSHATMADMKPATSSDLPAEAAQTESELPKLSAAEYRIYNRMSEHMDYFHNHFRQTWNELYKACETSKRAPGVSLRQFISQGLQFCSHLSMHHGIEEQHIFPVLAKKMPEFRQELELLTQHKQIHAGMDQLEEYLHKCRSGETELRLDEMKTMMDSFREVLWTHLDQEVKTLGAENMRKYWTVEEMRRMPM